MRIGRVIGNIVSSDCHPAHQERKLMLARILDSKQEPTAEIVVAIDYVQAGPGDLVLVGAAPGLASVVFGVEKAPIEHLIMGIIDHVGG